MTGLLFFCYLSRGGKGVLIYEHYQGKTNFTALLTENRVKSAHFAAPRFFCLFVFPPVTSDLIS